MRLLLLLSALLAALSGATAGARAPRVEPVEVAAGIAAPNARRAHAHVLLVERPTAAPLAAACTPLSVLARPAAPRLWMQRRRE